VELTGGRFSSSMSQKKLHAFFKAPPAKYYKAVISSTYAVDMDQVIDRFILLCHKRIAL
jgi:hypothetical protein